VGFDDSLDMWNETKCKFGFGIYGVLNYVPLFCQGDELV
jgi:hypothetical protein